MFNYISDTNVCISYDFKDKCLKNNSKPSINCFFLTNIPSGFRCSTRYTTTTLQPLKQPCKLVYFMRGNLQSHDKRKTSLSVVLDIQRESLVLNRIHFNVLTWLENTNIDILQWWYVSQCVSVTALEAQLRFNIFSVLFKVHSYFKAYIVN